MDAAILELEQRDIELRLEEISLKRRQLEIEREQLTNKRVSVDEPEMVRCSPQHLIYSKHVQENHMKIADICPDGSILISHGGNSRTVSKKYSMRTLSWIRQKLPSWVNAQREENYFWDKLAGKYTRKFLPKGESISRTTMERLCYLVDSGEADVWFEKYGSLKGMGKQSTLDGA